MDTNVGLLTKEIMVIVSVALAATAWGIYRDATSYAKNYSRMLILCLICFSPITILSMATLAVSIFKPSWWPVFFLVSCIELIATQSCYLVILAAKVRARREDKETIKRLGDSFPGDDNPDDMTSKDIE